MEPLRVEILYDDESRNWHFQVPALHIVGGGAKNRVDVERQCVDAVAFARDDDPGVCGGAVEGNLTEFVHVVDVTGSPTAPDVA